jgi:hypothetical protein
MTMKLLMLVVAAVAFSCLLSSVHACIHILASSHSLGNLDFVQLPLSALHVLANHSQPSPSGRPVYEAVAPTDGKKWYLYHELVTTNGMARWIINDVLGDVDRASMYVNSWAVAPHLAAASADYATWMSFQDNSWQPDDSLMLECIDSEEGVVFFDSQRFTKHLTGYYVRRRVDESPEAIVSSPVFSQIKFSNSDDQLYLFRFQDKWVIGDVPGQDSSQAFSVSDTADVADISGDWEYLDGSNRLDEDGQPLWHAGDGWVITRSMPVEDGDGETIQEFDTIVDAVRFHRSIKFIPTGQQYFTLRNGVPMPMLGFGTGGLRHGVEMDHAIETALRKGYRMLDMAREYENEHVLPSILSKLAVEMVNDEETDLPRREEIFVVTKVWPTQLGFQPTSEAIETSLLELDLDYVDLYLIHWPR